MEIELSEVLAKRHLERQEARVRLDVANEQKMNQLREEAEEFRNLYGSTTVALS